MIIRRPRDIAPSEITSKDLYEGRRQFLTLAAGASILGTAGLLGCQASAEESTLGLQKLRNVAKSPLSTSEASTAYKHVTG